MTVSSETIELDPRAMPTCFAYGANMCRDAMARRCPGAEGLGRATLPGWRFLISADGYATVAPDPRATVHGVLWRLDEAHLRTLDAFENVRLGLYRRASLRVTMAGSSWSAVVYVGRARRPGLPVGGYMTDVVLPAARDWGLPERYLREIGRFAKGPKAIARAHGGL